MRPALLETSNVENALATLSSWSAVRADGGENITALKKEFIFKDFNTAFSFMARVAMMAERLDHHPDWSNAYGKVSILLATHDVGGVTELDLRLAQFCDAAAGGG